MGGTSRTICLLACLLMLGASLPLATAHPFPASSNCSLGDSCHISKKKPVDLQILACNGGQLGVATYGGKGLDQSAPGCTADFWTIAVGTHVYEYGELDQYLRVVKSPLGDWMSQTFHLTKYGEDVYIVANYTLVNNGTLIRYTAHNHGASPIDVGWKYSWDLQLDGMMDPYVYVDNRPGDGKGPANTYGTGEVDFGPDSHDIRYVKYWQSRTGPDGANDLKGYFWLDPDWGACPADRINYINSGAAFNQQSSLTYQPNKDGQQTTRGDSEMQIYWGSPELIHLEADDGQEGGPDEFDCPIWLGTNIPDPLISYQMGAYFTNRGSGATFSTAFVDAGKTASFPITLVSNTALGAGKSLNQRYKAELQPQSVPKGWVMQLVDDATGQPATDVVLATGEVHQFRLDVTAPRDAYGNDVARVVVDLATADPPHGLYNKRKSTFEVPLAATTIVRPNYGIRLHGPDEVRSVAPGESLEFPLTVTNVGNLRDPFNIQVDMASGIQAGWGLDIQPSSFALARGQAQEVRVRIDIPADEFGGERTVVARAGVPERDQYNTTLMKFKIISGSSIQIIPDTDRVELAPGATGTFKAHVVNVGFDEVAVDLKAIADEVREIGFGSTGQTAASAWVVDVIADGFDTPLQPGASVPVTIQVTAPADAKAGEQKNVLLFASEKGRTNELDKQLVRAVVIRTTTLEAAAVVDALNADPGRPMDFVVKFRNNGNAIENLTIDMTQLPAGWTSVITPDRFQLADGGQERSVVVTVLSPADALAGSYPLEVQARNADQVRLLSATAALGARINQVYGGQISTETPVLRILPKDQAAVQFQVTNTGNGPDAFLIDGLPSTWDVKVDPPVTPLLAPGASALIQVSGTFSGQVGTQKVPLFLVSQGQGQAVNDQPLPFTLIVSRPDLYVKSAKVVSKADHAGDLEVIAAEIENLGGIEAKKVTVALFVDGKPTGITATFDRLAPERTLVASLPWTKTAGDHSYRIEVDPENQIDEGEGEGNNAVVLKAGTLETQGLQVLGSEGKIASQLSPATGAWTALLLVALAAAWTRRRRDA